MESPFETTIRLGIERRIVEAFNAHDINLVNEQLDIYPTGHKRPDVAINISQLLSRDSEQDLINFRKAA